MTRREWLAKHPRPKSAVKLRELLNDEEEKSRNDASALVNQQGQLTVAQQQQNHTWISQVQAEVTKLQTKQAESRKLIAQLNSELARAAKCPTHQLDLHHHRNRPEDLYLCENGPHWLIWTPKPGDPGMAGVLESVDMAKPLPDLDGPLTA